MTILTRYDAELHFRVHGEGPPVLLFAPGGMWSAMQYWRSKDDEDLRPWPNWPEVLAGAGFTAIEMDQRNAGSSKGAVRPEHSWHTYADDHLALMDFLGHEHFHVL